MNDSAKAWLIGVLISGVTVVVGAMGYTQFLNERKSIREIREEVASLNEKLGLRDKALSNQGKMINEALELLTQTNKNLSDVQEQEHTDFVAVMKILTDHKEQLADQHRYIKEVAELAKLLSDRALSQAKK